MFIYTQVNYQKVAIFTVDLVFILFIFSSNGYHNIIVLSVNKILEYLLSFIHKHQLCCVHCGFLINFLFVLLKSLIHILSPSTLVTIVYLIFCRTL